jgi:O-antigen/teichoic acid export membrane protein
MKNPAQQITTGDHASLSPYSRENVRKGILHYSIGRGMSGIAGFFSVVLLVRYMDVAAYAGYTAMIGLIAMAGMLSGLGMERALVRFIPEGRLHQSSRALARLVWISALARLSVAAAITLAIYLLWPSIAGRFASLAPGAFPLPLALLLSSTVMFQLFSSVLQALVQQKMLTRVMVIQWGGRLSCIVALVVLQGHIDFGQALWIAAAPDAAGLLVLILVVHRHLAALHRVEEKNAASDSRRWPCWPKVTHMALHNYGYNLVAALPQSASMIVLAAAFLAAPFVAAYGFYISMIDRLKQYLPLQFMLNLAEPVLLAGYVKDKDFAKLCHRAQLLYKSNLLLLMPFLAWIGAIAPDLTSLLTGGKYADHAWLLLLLIFQLALGSHATVVQIVINGVGKSEILTRSGLSALAAMALAIVLAIGAGRHEYIVAAPLVYEAVNNAVAIAALRARRFMYDPQWMFHLRLSATTVVAYLCAHSAAALVAAPIIRVAIAAAASGAAFAFIAVLFGTIDRTDVHSLRSMLRPARR